MARKKSDGPEPLAVSVSVQCIVPNVWTSVGKMLKGDVVELPIDEAMFLIERKQVKEA